MTPETFRYALVMLAAGIGIPVLAALNAQLGNRIGSPAAAATILFIVALCATTAILASDHGSDTPGQCASPAEIFAVGRLSGGVLRALNHLDRAAFRCGQCHILRSVGPTPGGLGHRSFRPPWRGGPAFESHARLRHRADGLGSPSHPARLTKNRRQRLTKP